MDQQLLVTMATVGCYSIMLSWQLEFYFFPHVASVLFCTFSTISACIFSSTPPLPLRLCVHLSSLVFVIVPRVQLYQNLPLSSSVRISLVESITWTTGNQLDTTSTDASTMLNSFRSYHQTEINQDPSSTPHDSAMLIT